MGQEGGLVIPPLREPARMERDRDDRVGTDLGGTARAAQKVAQRLREVRPVFVFQTANGGRQRPTVVTERHIHGRALGVERVSGELRGGVARVTCLDRRRTAGAEHVMARHREITRSAPGWAQDVDEKSDQHERCIVQIAPSVAPAVAVSLARAGRGAASAAAKEPA
jgi:hypothetical protein